MKNLKSIFLAILIGFFVLIPGIADSDDPHDFIHIFKANPTEIYLNNSVILEWEAHRDKGVVSCYITDYKGEVSERLELGGRLGRTPTESGVLTFMLECRGGGKSGSQSVSVTVKERDPDQNQVQPPVQDPDQDRVRPPAQEKEERRGVCEGPLVPCGPDRAPCELCHIFILFNNIIQFVLICLVPPVAVAMLVIGGFVLMFAGGAPQLKSKAMSILKSAVIGLFIIYGAWLFINTFLAIIGVMDWTGLHEWFQPAIDCPPESPPEASAAFGQQGAEG